MKKDKAQQHYATAAYAELPCVSISKAVTMSGMETHHVTLSASSWTIAEALAALAELVKTNELLNAEKK